MDWGFIILMVWIAGMVFLQVPVTIWVYRNEEGDNAMDFAMFFFLVVCFIWAWPLLIPGYYGWQFVKDDKNG